MNTDIQTLIEGKKASIPMYQTNYSLNTRRHNKNPQRQILYNKEIFK